MMLLKNWVMPHQPGRRMLCLTISKAVRSTGRSGRPSGSQGGGEPPQRGHDENIAARARREYDKEVAVYVHWPYCRKHCTYCNFNKYVKPDADVDRLARCLLKELSSFIKISSVRNVRSVFFGGGTPSLAPPDVIYKFLDTVSKVAYLAADTEVSLEANPTDMTVGKLRDLKAAGINRLSVGLQSLSDSNLFALGREHSADEATRFLIQAKHVFSGRTSTDILFGCPGQDVRHFVDELLKLVEMSDAHVSLYQLTMKPGTELYRLARAGAITLPDEDALADMYECSVDILTAAGFTQYEVSNFARTPAAKSAHNMAYWEGRQYIGVGPGAHGRFIPRGKGKHHREIWINIPEPERWMTEVEVEGLGVRKIIPQSQLDVLQEVLALGLRTREGVPNSRWLMNSQGYSLRDVFGGAPHVKNLMEGDFLELTDECMRPTKDGMRVLDSVLPPLMLRIEHFYANKL